MKLTLFQKLLFILKNNLIQQACNCGICHKPVIVTAHFSEDSAISLFHTKCVNQNQPANKIILPNRDPRNFGVPINDTSITPH